MFKRLSIRSKLILILVSVSMLAALVVIGIGYYVGNSSISKEVYDRLTSVRNAKKYEVEHHFENLASVTRLIAENELAAQAVVDFSAAFQEISQSDTINCGPELSAFYADFVHDLGQNLDVRRDVDAFYPKSTAACYLQYHYIIKNPNPVGRKDELRAGADGSVYSSLHERYHDYFTLAQREFGFYDIFLIDARTSDILYTVYKETDFATNLAVGPYRNSNLATLVEQVRRNVDLDEVQVVDFAFYRPSFGRAAAFMGAPVIRDDELIGVVAVQIPIDEVNAIMTYGGNWTENGLGETGEALLVGDDFLLRSDPRLYLTDSSAFYQELGRTAIPHDRMMGAIRRGPILNIELRSRNVADAIRGESGVTRLESYYGREVLSAFAPLTLPGNLRWSLITEIDADEAFIPVVYFQRINFLALAGIIGLVTLLAMYLTRLFACPLDRLTEGALAVQAGDTTVRVPKTTDDELGQLTDVFNNMIVSIDAQKEEIIRGAKENDALLYSRFPAAIAERYRNGETNLVDQFEGVTVLCCDLRGTAEMSELPVEESWGIVQEMSEKFSRVSEELGVEVIYPIPDGYVAVCGMNVPRLDNGRRIVILAMRLREVVENIDRKYNLGLTLNIGLSQGDVLAGILQDEGRNYAIWGPTTDEAQRLAAVEEVNVTLGTKPLIELLLGNFKFGELRTYPLTKRISIRAGKFIGRIADLEAAARGEETEANE